MFTAIYNTIGGVMGNSGFGSVDYSWTGNKYEWFYGQTRVTDSIKCKGHEPEVGLITYAAPHFDGGIFIVYKMRVHGEQTYCYLHYLPNNGRDWEDRVGTVVPLPRIIKEKLERQKQRKQSK